MAAFLSLLISVFIILSPAYAETPEKPLSLEQSIEIALQNSTAVRAAQHAVAGADYDRKSALTDFLPKIGSEYSYTRLKNEPVMKSPPGDFFPYPSVMKIGTRDNYKWSTHLSQPLFTGGAIRSAYQISRLSRDIAEENMSTAIIDTVFNVKDAYFSILKAEKINAVVLKSVEQVKSHLDVAKAFYEQEMIPKNDLLEAEVRYSQARQDLITSENRVEVAKAYFNTVLRRHINEPVIIEDILVFEPEDLRLEECLSEALKNRPEVKAAMLRHEQAQKGVNLSRSRFFPQIALVAEYQKKGDSPDVRGSRYEAAETSMIYTVLSWDIWQWGKRSYQVSSSRAKVLQTQEQMNNVTDTVSLEVKQSWLNYYESKKNIAVAKTAIDHAEEDLRLNRLLYEEQMATTTDVLDSQTRLTHAYSNYYNALSDCHIAKSMLERAIGR